MRKKEKKHLKNNFSDARIFNDEQIAMFATIKAAYEDNIQDFSNEISKYKKRYKNLYNLQSELFISSSDLKKAKKNNNTLNVKVDKENSNLFIRDELKFKIYNHTGLKIGFTSRKEGDKLTIFIGISGYEICQFKDVLAVLITECKRVLQGQVIQAVALIKQLYEQIDNKEEYSDIEWILGGHSLGGNIIQSVAGILSLSNDVFNNRYSIINSKQHFNKRPIILAEKVYTFNSLQPKVFLRDEFEFLSKKTINFVINNDWLLRVLMSNNGSYIGELQLFDKEIKNNGHYSFTKIANFEHIPINIKKNCVINSRVRSITLKDIRKNPSLKKDRENILKRITILIKSFFYATKLVSYKIFKKSHREHEAINFIANVKNDKL